MRPAVRILSSNYDLRPPGCEPDLLIIHNISLPPGHFGGDAIECLFTNCLDPRGHPYFAEIAGLRVSSHLLVRRSGAVLQFVNLNRRAWHAGVSAYAGRRNCNDFSIGVELEGTDTQPYTDRQYAVLGEITLALLRAFPALSPGRIAGHCDVAPGRKTDPGGAFDWDRYARFLTREANPG